MAERIDISNIYSDERKLVAIRGIVIPRERRALYDKAAEVANTGAGRELFIVNDHSQQIGFDGRALRLEDIRVVVGGGWAEEYYATTGPFWAAMRELEAIEETAEPSRKGIPFSIAPGLVEGPINPDKKYL